MNFSVISDFKDIASVGVFAVTTISLLFVVVFVVVVFCLSICLFVCLYVCLYVCLLVCLFVCLFVCNWLLSINAITVICFHHKQYNINYTPAQK